MKVSVWKLPKFKIVDCEWRVVDRNDLVSCIGRVLRVKLWTVLKLDHQTKATVFYNRVRQFFFSKFGL
jgi:hypothetical protein